MSAPGQLDLDGGEEEDPRIKKAAKALFWRDAKRTWSQDGWDSEAKESVASERSKVIWPRVEKYYVDEAEVALRAAGVL